MPPPSRRTPSGPSPDTDAWRPTPRDPWRLTRSCRHLPNGSGAEHDVGDGAVGVSVLSGERKGVASVGRIPLIATADLVGLRVGQLRHVVQFTVPPRRAALQLHVP